MSQVPVKKFEQILRVVWDHLIAANVHLTIWEELHATPERRKLCDTYPWFFNFTRDAHVDRFINKMCVVTDTDKDQPSVVKLANMVQAHPTLAPGVDSNNLLQRLENHAKIGGEIRAVRNRRSSHWDLNKMPPAPNVAKCRTFIDELQNILEDVWNAHKPSVTGGREILPLGPRPNSHTAFILDELTARMMGSRFQR